MSKCTECKKYDDCRTGSGLVWPCGAFAPKLPMTNADRIRAMSDEELATDLIDMFQEICEDGVPSKEWMLEWLRKPAEEVDKDA